MNRRGCAETEPATTGNSWGTHETKRNRVYAAPPPQGLEPLAHVVGMSAMVPIGLGDVPTAVAGISIEPTHEDVARRAYQLYEERGGRDGRDQEDWFQAERELRQFLQGAADKFLAADGPYATA
jgi:hypothetical protein